MSMTIAQLAERWNCDRRTVMKLVRQGLLEAFQLRPGSERPTYRFTLDAVQRYESQRAKVASG